MTLLTTANQIRALPVVTLGGDDIAEVKDVVYDSQEGRIVGLTLNSRSWFGGPLPEVLPWDRLHAVGRDAVMITDTNALTSPSEAPVVSATGPDRNVVGDLVITDEGTALGHVVDLVVEVDDRAEVVGYVVRPDAGRAQKGDAPLLVPLPEQLSVSGDSLIVPSTVEAYVRDDLTGFGAAVDDFRARLQEGESARGRTAGEGTRQ